jgi:photosystem II stability/assembly factor-like uncharacterized protein
MRSMIRAGVSVCLLLVVLAARAGAAEKAASASKPDKADKAEAEKKGLLASKTWKGLELRSIGPALTSGRISDIAVEPGNASTFYVAAASGGVWKTDNGGTTFTPVFDGEGSYSVGSVAIDAGNPHVVWVGSGEYNSQRSVSYGDGVYRSEDGGKSWQNMGLKTSEHIGKVLIDPRDSRVVYVAAQGPLWAAGGERGLYKTSDAGKTWKAVLTVSENTGITDVVMDPRNPDRLLAASYQRRRHVWTVINGGPESAIYRSEDAGASWKKVETGLPKEDMGRIGLAVAPSDPDTVYAVIEAANKAGGVFRSTDRGATWEKRGSYATGSGQYYTRIFVDPKEKERLYAMDVYLHVSDDAGKTFRNLGESSKHVDNHAMWIDPGDTRHLLVGCDGGLYESLDRGASWRFFGNLPVTQFYRVTVDEASPVYNVYGGTQDNFTLGGPSRTLNVHGIRNTDWFVTVGGDGFQPRVDPKDPNIVYGESQHGGLLRFDRKNGDALYIKPEAAPGEAPLRWNWDSPLLISPHDHNRLYFAAQRIFRSDDRGETWKPISPDLTRQIDRNTLPVMGKVWPADAVARGTSTSFYGNIVSLSESAKVEGLLYAGTDDGLVQVTEDGGGHWRRIDRFPGVPDRTYVARLEPSPRDASTVYAAFDNHKMGDFKPYVLKSADRGASWTSIAGDLPLRGTVYCVVEDPGDPGLLFAGTEFGLFFTKDGGAHWVPLKGGLPTIAVRDLAFQARENDLVLATFGRGFYVLDDVTPLRAATEESLSKEAQLFPVRKASLYVPMTPLGVRGKGFQGDALYAASNPPFGAVFTYYLKEDLKTRKELRHDAEKKLAKEGGAPAFPTPEELRAEAAEEEPVLVFTITDSEGHVVRRLTAPGKSGFHRIAWNLRYPPANPTDAPKPDPANVFEDPPTGPLAVPGAYRVSLARRVDGRTTELAGPVSFEAEAVGTSSLPPADRAVLLGFQKRVARLQRAALGAVSAAKEGQKHLEEIRKALLDTPAADASLTADAQAIGAGLREVLKSLEGDRVLAAANEPTPPSIVGRIDYVVNTQWTSVAPPTKTSQDTYAAAASGFTGELAQLKKLLETDLKSLEARMEKAGAPWTPGRLPDWKPE